MKALFGISLLTASLPLAVSTTGEAAQPNRRSVIIDVETLETAIDGPVRRGCRAQFEVAVGNKHEMWISVGNVTRRPEETWQVKSRTHCGDGIRSTPGGTLSTPYLILGLELAPNLSGRNVRLEASLTTRKFSRFDDGGRPVHTRSNARRTLRLPEASGLVHPLLVTDSRERESLGVYDVLLRVRARISGGEPTAAYGRISLAADIPGAEILLDGGFVGRTLERSPTVLENVLVGMRELRLRDSSRREASRPVVVKRDRTSEVSVRVLNLPSPGTVDLAPIGRNPQGHEEYWRVQDGAVVVRVSAGEFLMGSLEDEGEPRERPQHRVHVSEFLIDKTEVTWRQFRKYAESTGKPLPRAPAWGTPDDYAASNILWAEANAYCDWVGGRLPTEAEWEKAARGTDGRKYSWGNEWDPDRCNSWEGGPHRPESVGSYPDCLSPYGVLDMPGSVWEWCADWYGESYYSESPSSDPKGPASSSFRVLRGAGWLNQSTWLRPAYRYRGDLTSRNVHTGFRCAQDPRE